MKVVAAILFLSFSYSSYADLVCEVQTLKGEKVLSDLTVRAPRGVTSGGHIKDLFQEVNKRKESTTIKLSGMMSGWEGDEYIEARIYRSEFKYKKYNRSTELTDTFKIQGNQKLELKYEDYITKISCVVDQVKTGERVVDSERSAAPKEDSKSVKKSEKTNSSVKK